MKKWKLKNGTATRMDSGKIQFRYRDRSGIQRARTFKNLERAGEFDRELDSGEEPESELTFGEFSKLWLRDYSQVQRAESQWKNDQRLIGRHLLPSFEAKLLTELTKRDLLFLQAKLKNDGGRSIKTINLIIAFAKKMLATAVDWDLLKANSWAGVKMLKQQEQAINFWSIDERERFLIFCQRENPNLAAVVEFACHTGLRQGEIRGLKRDCLDFNRRTILVRRAWGRDCGQGGKLLEHTKGKKARQVEMNDAVYRLLRAKQLLAPSTFVFEFNPGHLSRTLKLVSEKAGVNAIRFHDLRHTFASHLAMAGVSLQKIQYLLGHVDYKQTQRYAHLLPESVEGITSVLVSGKKVHAG